MIVAADLEVIGKIEDRKIDLARAALLLAAGRHQGIVINRYHNHIQKMENDVTLRFAALIESGAEDDVMTRLAALKHILSDQEGYAGDADQYDHIDNADLIRVIDRRKGMPIALSILYIQCGRAHGWRVDGLNMPGHFLCRIEHHGQRVIFDPFAGARILNAADMRQIIKKLLGPQAELSSSYTEPATNREILIRLQNNIKLRLIEDEEYENALVVVESMRKIDPGEYRLLFDSGILYARVGQNMAAARALESYIDHAPQSRNRQEAALLLQQIRQKIN